MRRLVAIFWIAMLVATACARGAPPASGARPAASAATTHTPLPRGHAVARSGKAGGKSTFQDIVGWADYRDGKTSSISGITVGSNGKRIEIKFAKVFCPATAAMGSAGGGILPSAAFKKVYDPYTTD